MNHSEEQQIGVEWEMDAPFRVQVKRTVPTARRLPAQFFEPYFYNPDEEAWTNPSSWA
jgi:hypothetical protein